MAYLIDWDLVPTNYKWLSHFKRKNRLKPFSHAKRVIVKPEFDLSKSVFKPANKLILPTPKLDQSEEAMKERNRLLADVNEFLGDRA